jgi:hypothetical protein
MRASQRFVALALAGLGLVGCQGDGTTTSEERVRRLSDSDGDGLMEEQNPPDDPVILPDPGDCPILQYTETHTVTYDEMGNVVSETWTVCTQCFEEDGTTPIGEEQCYDEPPLPPEVYCEEYDSGDPTVSCYFCVDADGNVIIDECWPLPVECDEDADCPEGQICYLDDYGMEGQPGEGGMDAPTPVSGGICGYPDPCVPVDSLPEDPTGESCWQCTDPVTGESWGAWCDVHVCGDDGSCFNPWEICDPASGTCVYDDPCDPVASLPSDPTGSDCWQCIDPVTGEDWGSWCNVHTCTTDADCPPDRFEICDTAAGICVYDDPCDPVPSLPSDPTGSDCYQCIDPVTGDDWGGWCNVHSCTVDSDCTDNWFGDVCVDGVCAWSCGDGMGQPGQP